MAAAVADDPPVELPFEAEELLIWLATERGRAPSTIEAYRRDLISWSRHLDRSGVAVTAAAAGDVRSFLTELDSAGLARSTVVRRLVAVRSLYRYLLDEERIDADPTADIDAPRRPDAIPKALSEVKIEALLESVVGDDPVARRDRAVLEVLYGTGIRVSELVGLSLGDIDLYRARMRVFGKGSKERVVPIGRLAGLALEAWLDDAGRGSLIPKQWKRRGDAEALFLNHRGGRITRQGLWLLVSKYGRLSGLGDDLSPHVLRHTCATHMVDHGADLRVVQELLGHSSVSTTQIYTRVSTERLWAVYDSAHPRAGVPARPTPP